MAKQGKKARTKSAKTGPSHTLPHLTEQQLADLKDPTKHPFRYEYSPGPSPIHACGNHRSQINLVVNNSTNDVVASMLLLEVCRTYKRSEFMQRLLDADTPSRILAVDLFDRHGTLKQDLIHGSRRGSGVWGSEDRNKNLLFIKSFYLKGLSKMTGLEKDNADDYIKQMIERALGHLRFEQAHAFAVVKASNVAQDIAPAPMFLRSFGFRRIGDTDWFGLPSAKDHPALHLAPGDDFDPEKVHVSHALLEAYMKHAFEYAAHGDYPFEIGLGDQHASPMEALEGCLAYFRTLDFVDGKYRDVSDCFRGYRDEHIRKITQLKGLMQPLSPIQYARLQYGCSCGQCMEGYLSPRMKFTLSKQAGKIFQLVLLDMSCDDTRLHLLHHPDMVSELEGLILVHQPMCKTVLVSDKGAAIGLSYIFWYILHLLNSDIMPTRRAISSAIDSRHVSPPDDPCPCCGQQNNLPPDGLIMTYFGINGNVGSCLDGLMECSIGQDEKAGDNTFHQRDVNVEGWNFADEYRALPRCRNDSEFKFVLGMLKEKNIGPYDCIWEGSLGCFNI